MERIRIVRNSEEVKPLLENLKEILVSEVTENTDLNHAYIRGHIVSHCSTDSGSSLLLTIQGDGLQFTTVIRGEAASHYPDASTGGILYLHGGSVDKSEPEWSQASGFQLVVDDTTETKIILLHKDIKDPKRKRLRRQVKEHSIATTSDAEAPSITVIAPPPPTTTPPSPPPSTPPPPPPTTAPPPIAPVSQPTISSAPAALPIPSVSQQSPPPAPRCAVLHTSFDEVEMLMMSRECIRDIEKEGDEEGEEPEHGGGVLLSISSRQKAESTAQASRQSHRKRAAAEMDTTSDDGEEGNLVHRAKEARTSDAPTAPCRQKRRVLADSDSSDGEDKVDASKKNTLPGVVQQQGKGPTEMDLPTCGDASRPNPANRTAAPPTREGASGSREHDKAYKYTKIAQLKSGDDRMNVFGVVKFFKPILQTKGTDFYTVLTIVDESCPTTGLKCVIFNRSRDKLPHVRSIGDIICLHRLKIQTYKEDLQAMGRNYTSSICFDGKPNSKIVPRTGSQVYSLTDDDVRRVKALREWGERHAELNPETRARHLCDVSGGDYFDLTCQVVSKSVFPSQDCTILSVWDGTKFPLDHKQYDYSYSETTTDPALVAAAGDLAVPVILYDNHATQARAIRPGHCVRLSNVHAVKLRGHTFASHPQFYMELCIHRGTQYGSGATVLGDSDEGVVQLKARLTSHVGAAANPSQCWRPASLGPLPRSATVIPYTRVAFTSIRDVLAYSTVPFKFNCRARVVCVLPACVEDMVQLRCSRCARKVPMPTKSLAESDALVGAPCPTCVSEQGATPSSEAVLRLIYVFKLVLEDDTGHLSAYVAEDDAITFLPGLPPTNLYVDQELRLKLLDRLYYLTGNNDPFVEHQPGSKQQLPRPWMECCLKSYYHGQGVSGDGGRISRKVNYRVFDTILNSLEPEGEEAVEEGGTLSDSHEDN